MLTTAGAPKAVQAVAHKLMSASSFSARMHSAQHKLIKTRICLKLVCPFEACVHTVNDRNGRGSTTSGIVTRQAQQHTLESSCGAERQGSEPFVED